MNEISSAHNPKYKRWLSLLEAKGIKKEGLALVSGEKLVGEMLRDAPASVQEILLPPKFKTAFGKFPSTQLTSPLFRELDVIGTHSPIAVVKIKPIPEWISEPARGLEVIVSLSDPSNLGALLRSAEAFGVARIILTKECASPYLPKALKAASNATFRVNLASTGSLKDIMIENAFGLDMSGENLSEFKWPKDVHLVLGEEGQGLPAALKIKRLKIPMSGKIESLNATVAASIAFYSYQA